MNLTRRYGQFAIEFIIPNGISKCLARYHIDINDVIADDHEWFEQTLFDTIDVDGDGIPDAQYGRTFKIIFYGVVFWYRHGIPRGFEVATNDTDNNDKQLACGERRTGPLYLRYRLLMI